MRRKINEDIFVVRQWDDFQDDGSDDDILAIFSNFEDAEKTLFALTRQFFVWLFISLTR